MDEEMRIKNSEIEDSSIRENKIIGSNVEDSKIKDSAILDSDIKESEVVDSKIESSKLVGESIKKDNSKDILSKRKKNLINIINKKNLWVIGFLIIALILGIYIRSMPMHDHGGNPGLWDITTNTWTLGPDLDPWLFTRYAKTIVEEGSLPERDMMRFVPGGFDTSIESRLLPYMIAYTYYSLNIFMDIDVIYAAVIFPVIMFALTIISFFLFVREIFVRKSKKSKLDANIIAIISTFIMIVMPAFLSRTIAGIPEKESAGFFFVFLSFYLLLRSWKSKNIKSALVLAFLAGISTAVLGLIWGGLFYVLIPMALATMAAFILNKFKLKNFLVYSVWLFSSHILLEIFSNKYAIMSSLTSIQSGPLFIIFFLYLIHLALWNTKLSNIRLLRESKIPKTLISLIVGVILLAFLVLIILGPNFIIAKVEVIHQTIFQPVLGRWNTTVAENRQPYFSEWKQSFGPFIKNTPLLFWMFVAGSIILFRKALNKIKSKDAWILTGLYTLLIFGIIFSRYSATSLFNGDNFISKGFYYLSVLLFCGFFLYYLIKYYHEGHQGFEKIDYEYLILFSLFVFCLITARGAVRLIMVLAPITPIFVGFLIVDSIKRFKKVEDETMKMILGVLIIILLIGSIFTFWAFYKSVTTQAYNFIPSHYNQQWQKAMDWIRQNTSEDAVFAHWWDYGYWVQSIGERATVLDGGNSITYWNYLMGRLVLTGDNQEDALEFLYNHDATHLLIDSTDIGKYGAYSSIGSNEDYDRYSWMSPFLLDESQTQETSNQTILVYPGRLGLDEDLIIKEEGKEILLPKQKAGISALILPMEIIDGNKNLKQPYALIIYQGRQHKIFLRYLSINGGQFMDFESGIEATAYIFPKLNVQDGGVSTNPFGASLFISPRLMRGMMAQVYILNDPLDNFPNFNLIHTQNDLFSESLESQGLELPDFIYYQGVQGPIKIWEIEYNGDEEIKQEYLDKDQTKYINWVL